MRLALLYETIYPTSVEEPLLMLFLVGLDLDVCMMCEVGVRVRAADNSR